MAGAAMAALSAGPALSLSCVPPDPVATFVKAEQSEDAYAVLYGRFDFDASLMPDFDDRPTEEDISPVPATFSGMALDTDGFTIPYTTDLWIEPTCAGIWCGSMAPADNVLAFVRDRGDGTYALDLGPCPFWVHFDPSQEVLDKMTACLNGAEECSSHGDPLGA